MQLRLLEAVHPGVSLRHSEQRELLLIESPHSRRELTAPSFRACSQLQFVAASNLDVPTFQVTYVRYLSLRALRDTPLSLHPRPQNLKILTTALFSVVLLRRRLTPKKWLALFFLAAGVGVVQLQSTAAAGGGSHKEVVGAHEMDRVKGLLAVGSACLTSGLAGVYFEMVLKGSKADLWIRNVQLSFFSLLPALAAVFLPDFSLSSSSSAPPWSGRLYLRTLAYGHGRSS